MTGVKVPVSAMQPGEFFYCSDGALWEALPFDHPDVKKVAKDPQQHDIIMWGRCIENSKTSLQRWRWTIGRCYFWAHEETVVQCSLTTALSRLEKE